MLPREIRRMFASVVAVAFAMTACSGATSRQTTSSMIPGELPHQAGLPAAALAGGATTTDSRVATLNSWILSRATPVNADDDLPLGPGDLIVVSVFSVSELSQLNVRIPSNGQIALPLIGTLRAAGHTASELEDAIKARLQQRYMHDPQVTVFIQEHKSQQIAVFGAVKTGGVYPLVGHLRVTDALAMAGALNDDADHVVYLIRRAPAPAQSPRNDQAVAPTGTREAGTAETMIPIDLDSVIAERNDLNLPLQSGDVIHVPRAGSYYVGGQVVRPGPFLLKAKTTLRQAIVGAGDVTKIADWDDVRVYRPRPDGQSEVLKFSLNEFEQGDGSQGIEVKTNDVIIVGQSGPKAVGYWILDFIKFGMGHSF
jgi:polysaccharide export outer membrane protein